MVSAPWHEFVRIEGWGEKKRRKGEADAKGIYLVLDEGVLMECTQVSWVQVQILAVPEHHGPGHPASKNLSFLFWEMESYHVFFSRSFGEWNKVMCGMTFRKIVQLCMLKLLRKDGQLGMNSLQDFRALQSTAVRSWNQKFLPGCFWLRWAIFFFQPWLGWNSLTSTSTEHL